MPPHPTLTAREPLPDALRALAMLSVVMVNATGYPAAPWGPMLGDPAAGATLLLQLLVAALLQGKGYPIMAFAFGMGLWFSMQGRPPDRARDRALQRLQRLRRLGVVHGVFVYFGDILTLYGLVGPGLLRPCRERWRTLRRRIHRAVLWALAAMLAPIAAAMLFGWPTAASGPGEPTLSGARGWVDFWALNAEAYLTGLVASVVLAWPVVRLCMLCGIAAARLRLLRHRRWRAALARWTWRLAVPVGALNLAAAWLSVGLPPWQAASVGTALLVVPVALPLAAVYLMAMSLVAQGGRAPWCHWLAPLGARTLTVYIGHGLLCVLLFSGAGLAWRIGVPGMALFALAVWGLAAAAARASAHRRWPLETWLSGRGRA